MFLGLIYITCMLAPPPSAALFSLDYRDLNFTVMNSATAQLIKRVGKRQRAGLINKLRLHFLSPMTHGVEQMGLIKA